MDQNTRIIDVANNFMVVYVGEDKVITKASKTDVLFYAQRAVQELSYDTLKSSGSIEITLPASLQMALQTTTLITQKLVAWIQLASSTLCILQAKLHTQTDTNKTQREILLGH